MDNAVALIQLGQLVDSSDTLITDLLHELDDLSKSEVVTFAAPEAKAYFQRRLDRHINTANSLRQRMDEVVKAVVPKRD
jgi:hypothetical protein